MNALAVIDPADQLIQLEAFSYVPTWASVHAVGDKSAMPLFRQGEVAVFENSPKRIPEHGKLYVVEYGGHPIAPGHSILTPRSMSLVQAQRRQTGDQEFWSFRSYAGPIHWSDGWYPDEYAMAEKVLGPVVGIYAPSGSVRP
ncbi:hypothetical protein AYR46_03095 [Sphingobium yanoikuyae]|uniref:hypothetical protein n=1 Tax=Sphingobium yanoikuyae TaxID=13690 RepID=UPI0007A74A25|nr:hypothetical protein [Sphingobium yanoikuyae]KZC82906.1 hypothetical protein AYR46_03095 [Sphingobium yanoikuyae]